MLYTGNTYPEFGSPGAWYTMSDMLCQIGRELSRTINSAVLLVNGGEGAAYELASCIASSGVVIVMEGSGRFADAIVAWKRGKEDTLNEEQKKYLDFFLSRVRGKTRALKKIKILNVFDVDDPFKASLKLQAKILSGSSF